MHSPTDASSPSLRTATHGLGSIWIATPSSYRPCIDCSLPVSRRTAKEICTSSGALTVSPEDLHNAVIPILARDFELDAIGKNLAVET
jgi:hypothetical protein